MTTVGEIIARIEEFAPPYLAESWDPIGLAFGSYQQKVKKMMVALDLDADTLKEAKEENVDFIFTHHPPIFKALENLNEEDARRSEYIELIRSNISLYAAHTNIDAAKNGMNDWLAEALDLKKPYEVITHSYTSKYRLLVLYVPKDNATKMREALHQIGLGEVGDYRHVSYTNEGTGRFTPSEDAEPFIGKKEAEAKVTEDRIEILVPEKLINKAIEVIYKVHPYEEPVFHLMDINKQKEIYGIGRVGALEEEMVLTDFIEYVKNIFGLDQVRVANVSLDKNIRKIAILGGAGADFYKEALENGADVYITGDISYHAAQDMIREGLPFIDVGHFIENIFVKEMSEIISNWKNEENWEFEIIPSQKQKDVFLFK